ncbi:hypothetical protein WJX81_000683 [Elliptochloris bilobata]|uniref:Pyridoxamine 5'-phosphate oxidase Alr4036 family FMN-binding domain-containing protein n=1 Tax=Elliptochloris bilobata TaxID=381761 RepID=A0AAW1QID5_9CHLO
MAAPWRQYLMKSLDANKHLKYSTFMQLATVRTDGRPAVRTVVYRGNHGDSDMLTFYTDTRTPKVEQLQHNSFAELCWYFPDSREQFRIAGRLTLVGEDFPDADLRKAREDAWDATGTGTRAWFTWPTSGAPREEDEGAFNSPVPDGAVPSFALVLVDPQSVDYVLLPGERRRWDRTPKIESGDAAAAEAPATWEQQELNP